MINLNGKSPIVFTQGGATLVGGGPVSKRILLRARRLAPLLVAADGGADRLLRAGLRPEAVIGDLDSLSEMSRAALPDSAFHYISEQESTDFDKCLRNIAASFVLAVGFSGGRADHDLAAYSTLLRHPARRCILMGPQDICFLAPPETTLRLPLGTRLSIFPMGPVTGTSRGLRWPLDGLLLSPEGRIGTSNETDAPEVRLSFAAPRALVILPGRHLHAAIGALAPAGATAASPGG